MSQPQKPPRHFEPLRAIGSFMALFGFTVMAAAVMDMPMLGRMINLVCGGFLAALGLGAMIVGWRRSRKHKEGMDKQGGS
jgi:hypothetical protein